MNITIIGASAGVGLETVKRALQRNHRVTTLARSALPVTDMENTANLNALKGSALNKADLLKATADADAIVIALGTGKSMKPTILYSDFARLLTETHRETPSTVPVIVLTGYGAGESGQYVDGFVMRMVFKYLLKEVYVDKTRMEQMIAASDMPWMMVRPGLLKDKPLTEQYRVETELHAGVNIGSIRRADVADFIVKQAENPSHIHQYPALSNQ
jgi:uncharacterized protein YbjT (DUF2867 family)